MTAPSLPADLSAALEQAYRVFEPYALVNTTPCTHCVSEDLADWSDRRLTTTPLRDLCFEDVAFVCDEILTMFGDAEDAKYLAPRLLELVSAAWLLGEDLGEGPPLPGFFLDPPWVLRLFVQGSWSAWPDTERASVEACLRALWGHLIAAPSRHDSASWDDQGALLAIISLAPDPRPYLDGFATGTRQARRLAWFLRAYVEVRHEEEFGVSEVDERVEAIRGQIDAWLHGDVAREALLRAIADPSSEPFRWELLVGLLQQGQPGLVAFDGPYGQWVPDAPAQALAAELGVDVGGGPYMA